MSTLALPLMSPVDRHALLREIEEYLKELAGAAESEGVKTSTERHSIDGKEVMVEWVRFGRNEISTYDPELNGKKAGFIFQYRTPEGGGSIRVDLYNRGLVAVSMDVTEVQRRGN